MEYRNLFGEPTPEPGADDAPAKAYFAVGHIQRSYVVLVWVDERGETQHTRITAEEAKALAAAWRNFAVHYRAWVSGRLDLPPSRI